MNSIKLIFISFLIPFLLLEIFYPRRLFIGHAPLDRTPYLHFEFVRKQQGFYKKNKRGPGVIKRIGVIGDSMTKSRQHKPEETFSYFLNKEISDERIEVINLGVGGANLIMLYNSIEEFKKIYDLDFIILQLNSNDFEFTEWQASPLEQCPNTNDTYRTLRKVIGVSNTAYLIYKGIVNIHHEFYLSDLIGKDNFFKNCLFSTFEKIKKLPENEVLILAISAASKDQHSCEYRQIKEWDAFFKKELSERNFILLNDYFGCERDSSFYTKDNYHFSKDVNKKIAKLLYKLKKEYFLK